MPRKILIADDNPINRQLLINTLGKDYDVIEAENGKEALQLMHKHYKMLSAVLLDIVMPEMDGYEVLRNVRDSVLLSQLPILIITGSEDESSRIKALSLGANDFILKPFNPEIVQHCLRNNIALRETASILNAIQKDKLTGLFHREAFFEKVNSMIRDKEPGHYILSCFDIDHFKLINDQYGAVEGDRILREIGMEVQNFVSAVKGVAGRISADNFAALIPADKNEISVLQKLQDSRFQDVERQSIVFSVGRYLITDLSLPASAIYDRAYIAKQSVKGRYDKHLAYFDQAMLEKLISDQQIIGEMEAALLQNRFEVWFQPQYNHITGALIGAEALARWRHPQKGIVPPDAFIPLFEQNGFIYEMDKYIWRETCRYMQKWMAEGCALLPVSVNVSRYDIFRADLIEVLTGLVEEYDIPIDLLRLEITESAFAKSTKVVVEIVKQLISLGFIIEIDDFGSGYSSLNTLKNVPAQVVKLDMRFLEDDDDVQRGGNILESVVRMTKWLGMSVIAEGVETKAQGDFLKSIGCSHVQGFLYAPPMPAEEYEAHCAKARREDRQLPLETVGNLDNNMFWNPNSMDTLIFNSYVGAACIFECHNGNIEMLRATDRYVQMLGSNDLTVEDLLRLDFMAHLDAKSQKEVLAAVENSARTKKDVTGELLFVGLPGCAEETYLRCNMRVIASTKDRQLLYCISENITAQRISERKERQIAKQLQELLDNLPGAAALFEYDNGTLSIIHLNKRYWEIMNRTPVAYTGTSALAAIHPDDREAVLNELADAIKSERNAACNARVRYGDNGYSQFHIVGRIICNASGKYAVYASFTNTLEEPMSMQEMLSVAFAAVMDSSSDMAFVKDKNLRYVCCSRVFAQLVGVNGNREIVGKTDFDLFSKAFAEQYVADDRKLMESGKSIVDIIEPIPSEDGRPRYANTSKYLLYDSTGNVAGVYGVGRDVTQAREAEARHAFLLNNIPGGVAIGECIWNAEKHVVILTYFSDGFCRLFGFTRDEYEVRAKTNMLDRMEGEHISELTAQMDELVQNGTPIDLVYRMRTKDNEQRWLHIKAVLSDRSGERLTVNAVLFDVTERQQALELLRISEEESRLAIQHSKTVVCRLNIAARRLTVPSGVDSIFEVPSIVEDVPYGSVQAGRVSPETADAYIAFYESIFRGEQGAPLPIS